MSSIAIVSLKYLEPEYKQTTDCLVDMNLPIFFADRDGVGNMSRAFNDAFIKNVKGNYEFVWFVTNITCSPDTPHILASGIRGSIVGAHPTMAGSDHLHQRQNVTKQGIIPAPFIEFTAPMFRADVFAKYLLDEDLWYYYMDLELCHRLHGAGYQVAVNHAAAVDHTYLRNTEIKHPVTELRSKLRNYISAGNRDYLATKYGPNWASLFNWKG